MIRIVSQKRKKSTLFFLFTFLMISGCASQPVLYPNAHLKSVGQEQAQKDVDDCRRLADEYVRSNPAAGVAGSTAVGGATGAAMGTAAGAVAGNIGQGAGIGAAAGAAGGLVQGIVKASEPDQTYRNFVFRCLKERGYEPIGWQ